MLSSGHFFLDLTIGLDLVCDLFFSFCDLLVQELYVWIHVVALLGVNVQRSVVFVLAVLDLGHHGVNHELEG